MHVIDGIAYADAPSSEIRIIKAKVVNDLSMLVTFSNGETRVFDAAPLLDRPAFGPLKSGKVFSNFGIDHGMLTWENGSVDIAPEQVYEMSYQYDRAI